MNAQLVVEERGVERLLTAAELPLVIGGPAAHIRPLGIRADRPLAYIGLDGEDPFIQPVENTDGLSCNGAPLESSQWLQQDDLIRVGTTQIVCSRNGAEVRLTVNQRKVDRATEPPQIQVAAPDTKAPGATAAVIRPVEFTPSSTSVPQKKRRGFRPASVFLWLALIGLGAVAWFLFTARSVEIRVTPEPDMLSVEGTLLKLEVGGRRLVRPGSYTVVAEKEGYEKLEAPLEVGHEANQVHELKLAKLPGRLVLTTIPAVVGAEVLIDGELVGRTPLEAIELAPGQHDLIVRVDRFDELSTAVEIEGAGSELSLSVELAALWASISFSSNPSGATIKVDGESIGRTPMSADILEGRYRVDISLNGFKPQQRTLVVTANQPLSVPLVELVPLDGNLLLTSKPTGATVTIDGEFVGETPLELDLEPGASHRVAISKLAYETAEREVLLQSGRTDEIHVELAATYGNVEVLPEPQDAGIWVDGEPRGTGRQTLELTAVPHQIEARKPGYDTQGQSVTPRPGFPQVVRLTLLTEEEAKVARRQPVIQTPQGQDMVLIQPGRFRMGASRREPGRRANETLHEVELTRPFYLATKEISNRQFREFRQQHDSGTVLDQSLDKEDYPVVQVTWEDAARYCNWLSKKEGLPDAYEVKNGKLVGVVPMTAGYRLPTEAEWSWAARFAGGRDGQRYPWGDELPVAAGSGNYADTSAGVLISGTLSGYSDSYPSTSPVDSFEADSVGLFNMGGNVAEWVHDYYTIYSSADTAVGIDPFGPPAGEFHVIRGSSWMDSTISELRLSYRDYGNKPRADLGFRIARYLNE